MNRRSKSILAFALAAAIAALLLAMTSKAHAQRPDRPSGDAAAQSNRGRGDDGNGRRGGGRRGRGRGRPDRRGENAQNSGDTNPPADSRPAATEKRSDADRLRDYAASIVDKYDQNGDKMLQASERAEMRGKPAEADLNHDDVITIDELVTHLSPKASGSAAATASSSRAAPTPRRDRDAEPTQRVYGANSGAEKSGDDQRKSYRFTSPAERLPAGLPSWFKSRDADGDGQVAMHEYSRSWSDRTAAEFVRYDKDNDGVITPAEAAR
jgi:hypothetical protein